MVIYREVSDWKSKATELLEALREIRANSDKGKYCWNRANEAIQQFERNK